MHCLLSPVDGAVKLAAHPGDFTAPRYVITVTASAGAGPSVTNKLTVNVINIVNDVPILNPSSQTISVSEDATAHTLVFHVSQRSLPSVRDIQAGFPQTRLVLS